jgi:phosphoribosylanthranilate isomerase
MSARPQRTRIKICGITSPDAAEAAVEAGADAIGFVFAPNSPRCVDVRQASEIAQAVGPFVTTVAVYQDPSPDDPALQNWLGDWLQMHGDEDETDLSQLRRCIIKGFRFDPEQVRRWNRCTYVDALLIDGPRGGSGEAFDHHALGAMMTEISRPVILAGGLTPENVGEAIRTVRPYAVDVSSGVETEPGVKSAKLIAEFCAAVREADGRT